MLELEKIFSDGMVLQREMPVVIWGTCTDTEEIEVSLGGERCKAAIQDGSFRAVLGPREAQTGLELTITARNGSGRTEVRLIRDVAVGEVWVASGQSNMEYPVRYTAEEDYLKGLGTDTQLRFFDVPKISYEGQEKDRTYDTVGFWDTFRADSIGNFSAVALHFAQYIRNKLEIPVGIIGCNWGATSASSWMEQRYLEEYPQLHEYLETYQKTVRDLNLDWYREAYLEKQAWGLSPVMQALDDRINRGQIGMDEVMELYQKMDPRKRELFELPVGPMDPRRPCVLYETMVKRIMGYRVRGVLWYQGEADEVLPKHYALLFSQLVKCWRCGWQQELPFLCVQLAPFGSWLGNGGSAFPELRRQQQRAEELLEKVWTASIMDAGMETDIHPKAKRVVGERLALLALGKVYQKEILCEAPLPADAVWEDTKITIFMAHAGDGLYRGTPGIEPAEPGSTEPVTAEPRSAEPAAAEPRSAEPAAAESGSAEPVTAEPRLAEPVTAEPRSTELESADPRLRNPDGLILTGDGKRLDFETEIRDCRMILHARQLDSYRHVQVDYAQQPYVEADIYNSAGLCAKPFTVVRPWNYR